MTIASAPFRVMTAGSVDDGKSTLIGRLLHDLDLIDHDVLADLKSASVRRGRGELDLSLFTDGLSAEREQGITIDVAYRYFRFGGRVFILADSPGHVQYTRNMVCAASQADCALIMVDARNGASEQTRRHVRLAQWLGVPRLVFVVNKLDLVGFSQDAFDGIAAQVRELAGDGARVIPVSALDGDNVVHRSSRMDWYAGPTLVEALMAYPAAQGFIREAPLRFPVQSVMRPTGHVAGDQWHDFRALSGRVDSGRVAVGDWVRLAGREGIEPTRIVRIHTFDGDRESAAAGDSVNLVLEDDVDAARGDVLVLAEDDTPTSTTLEVDACWMSEQPGTVGQRVLVKQASKSVLGKIAAIESVLDVTAGEFHDTTERKLPMNTVARVRLQLAEPLLADAYAALPRSGGLILIDPSRFDTLAAALIRAA